MRHVIACGALCALAGAAFAQPISPTETYEIFTLVGNTTATGTTLTAFLDNLPDGATFDGNAEDAGPNLGFAAGTVDYFVDEALTNNGDGTWTADITMFATDAATNQTLVSFVPGDRFQPALTTLFINFGVPSFGGSNDGISVPNLIEILGVGLTLFDLNGNVIDVNGANNADPADDLYQFLVFNLPTANSTELFAQIGIRALDGNIRADNFSGFTLSYTFTVPAPAGAGLLGLAGLAAARRRR